MAKDTPERFVKLVFAELVDIHALVIGIHDYVVTDYARKAGISMEQSKKIFEARRKKRGDKYLADLLKRVDLPNLDHQ